MRESTRLERISIARYKCEANGLHHKDCPGDMTAENVDQFCIHHTIRKSDSHAADHHRRDDVDLVLVVWNGPTGKGLAGCHNEIHSNQPKARDLGYLTPKPVRYLSNPFRFRDIPTVEHAGNVISLSTMRHQPTPPDQPA